MSNVGLIQSDLDRLSAEIAEIESLIKDSQSLSRGDDVATGWADDYRTIYLLLRAFLPAEVARDPDGQQVYPIGARDSGPILMWRLLQNLGGQVERYLGGLTYLGPLRQFPDRLYVHGGTEAGEVGKAGEHVPDLLFRNPELVERLNLALERFELGYRVEVSRASGPSADLRDVFAVRLKDAKGRMDVGLADVGFGVSQVLPVLVQSLLSRGATIAIEQPEIHLHPRMQAELGSAIAAATRPPYSNSFVIETHSEHLLLRLQRLMRSGALTPGEVAVIYVRKGRWSSQAIEIRLAADGALVDPWPGGFFEEGFREVFDGAL